MRTSYWSSKVTFLKNMSILLIMATGISFISVSPVEAGDVIYPLDDPIIKAFSVSDFNAQTTLGISPFQQGSLGVADLTFRQLGGEDFILRPHYSEDGIFFELPYRWIITPGTAYIDLYYDLITNSAPSTSNEEVGPGVIELYLDDELIATFIPQDGVDQSIRLPIPGTSFSDFEENEHTLLVGYRSRVRCTIEDVDPARVVIRDHSLLHVEYSQKPIQLDLTEFPRPLYQGLIGEETILIIIPDDYSEEDLSAAASVAAGIGSSTFGDLSVLVSTASEATSELMSGTSAVLVGTPDRHSLIASLYEQGRLPTTLSENGNITIKETEQVAKANEGVIQELFSDAGSDYVYLVVTGATSEAVMLAARGLSSLNPQFGLLGDVSIISEVTDFEEQAVPKSATLEELGLRDGTLYGFATTRTQVQFFVESNWIFEQDAQLALFYRHSAGLNSIASNLTVYLNNDRIGSAPLIGGNDQTLKMLLDLPSSDLRPGRNQITFEAALELDDPCADLTRNSAWIRILGESVLAISYQVGEGEQLRSLENPMRPFFSTADLRNVWFVLPEEPNSNELEGFLQTAWAMGESTSGRAFTPRVSMGSSVEEIDTDYHVLAIGRPTRNPLISGVNNDLYQPFIDGTDTMMQKIGNVIYRLPDDLSIGMVQLIRAPWNPQRALTVVTGSTDEAVDWALKAIVNGEPYTNLTILGNAGLEALEGPDMLRGVVDAMDAVTDGGVSVEVVKPSEDVQGEAGPEAEVGTTSSSDYAPPPRNTTTIFGISIGLVVLGAIVFGGGFWILRRRNR